jgi:hypothetical protein
MPRFLSRAAQFGSFILALSTAAAAHASVLYEFVPTSMSTPPGAPYTTFSVVGSLELTDAAVAAGAFDLSDVVDFSFSVNLGFEFKLVAAPSDPIPPVATGIVSPTGELTDGFIRHLTTSDSLEIVGDFAGVWTGEFITDGSADGCNLTAFPCQFTGTWEVVPVPEPGTLALLGAGGLAAVYLRRRRQSATL